MSNVITVSVPKDDLVALATAGQMLLDIARQKARTPDNDSYVREADALAMERRVGGLHGRVLTADEVAAYGRTAPADVHVMPEVRDAYEKAIAAEQQCDCSPDTIAHSTQPVYGLTEQAAPQMQVIDPADGLIDTVIDAGAAFAGAPLETINVIPPSVDPGFAERTAHLNGTMYPTLQPGVWSEPNLPLPPAVQSPAVTGVELDSRGLPWDRRIHSATKNKCKTGEWKNIKGVDKDMLAQVENELRIAMSGSATVTVNAPPAPPVEQTVIPTVPQPIMPVVPVAPVVPQAATPPVPPVVPATPPVPPVVPATPAGCPSTFPEFLQVVTGKCTARVLSYDEVTQTCQKHGLAGIPLLGARPDLIPTVYAELEALWLTRS